MNKQSKKLNQPSYLDNKPWGIVILSTLIVVFILSVFQPFNFNLNKLDQLKVLGGFAAIAFISSSIVFCLFPIIFKRFYDPDNWTIKKQFLTYSFFFLIAGPMVFIYDYFYLMGKGINDIFTPLFFTILSIDLFATLSIGSIPIALMFFVATNQNLKKSLEEARQINDSLKQRIKTINVENDNKIVLSGTTKETISLAPSDILYLEANGNYVTLFFMNNKNVESKLIRSTIKQMEEQLLAFNYIIRCHRAFIVNINHISSVHGNSQGCKLSIHNTEESIPVSRTYIKELKTLLS